MNKNHAHTKKIQSPKTAQRLQIEQKFDYKQKKKRNEEPQVANKKIYVRKIPEMAYTKQQLYEIRS